MEIFASLSDTSIVEYSVDDIRRMLPQAKDGAHDDVTTNFESKERNAFTTQCLQTESKYSDSDNG